jgi:Domain of unknown function (DUF4832)/Beta-galactosidase
VAALFVALMGGAAAVWALCLRPAAEPTPWVTPAAPLPAATTVGPVELRAPRSDQPAAPVNPDDRAPPVVLPGYLRPGLSSPSSVTGEGLGPTAVQAVASAEPAAPAPPPLANNPVVALPGVAEPVGPPLVRQGDDILVNPRPASGVVRNPGKGWVVFGSPSGQDPEVLKLASVGYQRFAWSEIEPEEGRFDFSAIDRLLQEWHAVGRTFAFGVMGAASSRPEFWVTPQWVFTSGAVYDTVELPGKGPGAGPKLVPRFDDPIYLDRTGRMLKALAARYDGDPRVAYLDIRSYGNWGEGHVSPFNRNAISAECYRQHVALHRAAFTKTQLLLPIGNHGRPDFLPVYQEAVAAGIGLRRDGICGNSDGGELVPAFAKVPAVFELYGAYHELVERGWWEGRQDHPGFGYRLTECVERGRPSYCDLSRGGAQASEFLAKEGDLIRRLANRLGYHFVLRQVRYPARGQAGQRLSIRATWLNQGCATLLLPARLSYALKAGNGRLTGIFADLANDPRTWPPDQMRSVSSSMPLTGVAPGTYQLVVSLRTAEASLAVAIDQSAVDGWYTLGPIDIR